MNESKLSKNWMTAAFLTAAIITSGCAGQERRVQAQTLPYSKSDVEAWKQAFDAFLDDAAAAETNEALIKSAQEAHSLIGLSPASRARELGLQAYCVQAVGSGNSAAWATGCFDAGGPLANSSLAAGRACGSPELEKALRAAIEIGGDAETRNLNELMKTLFRCHQQQGSVGELTKAGIFAKGRYGLPLSMLAWQRGLTLSLPTTDVVEKAANLMTVSLDRMTARRN